MGFPQWIIWVLSIIGSLIGLAVAYGFVIYVKAQGKAAGNKALLESNDALRNLLDDKEKAWTTRFDEVQKQQLQSVEKIGILTGKVEKLEKENGDFKGLILQSLNTFWNANPDIAARMNKELTGLNSPRAKK